MKIVQLTKWLSSIDRYNCIDEEHGTLAKKLLSLASRLKLGPYLREEARDYIIGRLKHLLRHESAAVVRNVVHLIIVLTDDVPSLPSELVLALMKEAAYVFSRCGNRMSEQGACMTVLIEHLVLDNEENQQLLRSSKCLRHILRVFSNEQFEDSYSVGHLNDIVNLLIAASGREPTNILNQISIGRIVIPKVVNHLNIWNSKSATTVHFDEALKDLLFLCRHIISDSESCQNTFLRCGGLKSLLRALEQHELMKEHMFIKILVRKSVNLDFSSTLFSSVVLLIDASITHNKKTCIQAIQLNAIRKLQQYLRIAPVDQQVFIVPCLVHLLEAEIVDPEEELLYEMSQVADNLSGFETMGIASPVLTYIHKKMHQNLPAAKKTCYPKGTPHPKKFVSVKMRKPLKRLLPSPSKSKAESYEARSEVKSKLKTPQVNPGSQLNSTAAQPKVQLHAPQQPSSFFLSINELLVFMNCIRIYGVNMRNVRRAFPFHKEMTPEDLYALWRAIWKMKKPNNLCIGDL